MSPETSRSVADERIDGVTISVAELVGVRGLLTAGRNRPAGRHGSPRSGPVGARALGRGMEYAETRAYYPGDDSRMMDWRVMARTGEAHTKLFTEEREHRFLLAVDLSASMFFGTRVAFKSWAAAQLAAHLGWMACYAGDSICGLVASPDGGHVIPAGRSRQSLLAIFHRLAAAGRQKLPPQDDGTNFNRLLRELRRVARGGYQVALVSDFLGRDDESDALLRDICAHNQVSAWWIHDASEILPWPAGHYPLVIAGQRRGIDIGAGEAWLEDKLRRYREGLESSAGRHGFALRPIRCNLDITRQLLAIPS